eukprot:m.1342474 g.1342474  ORF g.1342474 m.1342474 type:complete len:90 (-) comp24898_c1_seq34:2567-2836(-)
MFQWQYGVGRLFFDLVQVLCRSGSEIAGVNTGQHVITKKPTRASVPSGPSLQWSFVSRECSKASCALIGARHTRACKGGDGSWEATAWQ